MRTVPTWPRSAAEAAKPRRATAIGKPHDAKPRQSKHQARDADRQAPPPEPDRHADRHAHHLTPIACPIASLPQHITALARLPNQPRRSLLDPHHPLRYARRCNGANPPRDETDPFSSVVQIGGSWFDCPATVPDQRKTISVGALATATYR